ncbi:hypothetical protein ACFSL6_06460 [Paenibacillus thailandensis]|uniref:Uncharacterized protein n=1 Tax=Paenibacillus thailandensis TaxID=393250 RepID=A0ABW5QTZ1_9BACL
MDTAIKVNVMEKLASGELREIDEREWTAAMIESLNHVNYIMIGGVEYETIEGRLNVDTGALELLVAKVMHR